MWKHNLCGWRKLSDNILTQCFWGKQVLSVDSQDKFSSIGFIVLTSYFGCSENYWLQRIYIRKHNNQIHYRCIYKYDKWKNTIRLEISINMIIDPESKWHTTRARNFKFISNRWWSMMHKSNWQVWVQYINGLVQHWQLYYCCHR